MCLAELILVKKFLNVLLDILEFCYRIVVNVKEFATGRDYTVEIFFVSCSARLTKLP